MKTLFLIFSIFLNSFAFAESWPPQPVSSEDPGSASYRSELFHETFKFNGRTVELFAPQGFQNSPQKLSVIIYGHGQSIPVASYQDTFTHLARKGVAVIFPQFDTGFFDQNWRRMAADYVNLTNEVFKKYPQSFDVNRVVFSGHSKGAYVAIVAAGLPIAQLSIAPASVVLFDPAGYDQEYLRNIDPKIPVTLTWADGDSIIKESLVREIYDGLNSAKKQLVKVKSYTTTSPSLTADHFFVLTKKFSFGGRDGVTPLHYYGSWKWLMGAIWDLESGGAVTNSFIYGDQAASMGTADQHQIMKNY